MSARRPARAPGQTPARTQKSQVPLLLGAVLLAYLAQMTLNPIIAPLSREVGLSEVQVGITISVAAVMVVLTSQFWGRRSQSWGRKPVLVAAFALATVSMALFAVLAGLGMSALVTGTVLFVLFVLFRGVGFGTAIAAIPPTAQAYIADVTDDEESRVKGMAGVGAVQGIAMVAGAVFGGVLSAFGLMVPLIVIPVLLAIGLVILIFRLPREPKTSLIPEPAHIRASDPRVWPFLLAGFGTFTALGFVQVICGYLVQDRLGLDADVTGLVTGGVLLLAGIGMILAQSVIVPRSGWSPKTLLRVGSITACLGFVVLVPDLGWAAMFVSMLLIGVGVGTAMPGFTAGPSLLVRRDEQGGLAGLVGATNGLTFVVAPTASTWLYGVWPALPVIIGAVLLAVVAVFVCLHPRFRAVGKDAQPADAGTSDAQVERSDEG